MDDYSDHRYIIEFQVMGRVMRVSAVDPVSMEEACVIVPRNPLISKYDIQQLAIRKLERKLKQKHQEQQGDDNSPGGGGVIC